MSALDEQALRTMLGDFENLPPGLAEEVKLATEGYPNRYWVVDNSWSMGTEDGSIFEGETEQKVTRWAELGASIRWVAKISSQLKARTEFTVINPPVKLGNLLNLWKGEGSQKIVFGVSSDAAAAQELDALLDARPVGHSYLCKALKPIVAEILENAPRLKASDQKACLVIATDGEATDGDIAEVLQPLAGAPVQVIVRLCTNEQKVVDYWNAVDERLDSFCLDVLDDLKSEAKEVHKHNPWLAYPNVFHRLREWGARPEVLDKIDERGLNYEEAERLTSLLLLLDADGAESDPKRFLKNAKWELGRFSTVFDPHQGKCVPWIDVDRFKEAYPDALATPKPPAGAASEPAEPAGAVTASETALETETASREVGASASSGGGTSE